jgi:DNA-binding GntR family transcriptional regulator
MTEEHQTPDANLRTRVLEEVKELILSGDLPSGGRLHERNLSRQLGVSRVPLREAMLTLESQGLVEVRPRVGAFVKPLTRAYVEDLFEVRRVLEPLAASLAAKNRTDAQLETLESLFEQQQEALKSGDDKRGSLVNADFHLVILRASGNDVLYSIFAPLQSQIQRLFRRTIVTMSDLLCHDHGALLDAIRRQDPQAAAALAAEHVDGTRPYSVPLFG